VSDPVRAQGTELAGAYLDDLLGAGNGGSVSVFQNAQPSLAIIPDIVMTGHLLTIETWLGVRDERVILVVTAINGSPAFLIVLIRDFDADLD
jgi:hypothetical protein